MVGLVCLQGGGEFSPGCADMDAALLESAQGPVAVLALAAAPGREYAAAHGNGVRWFRSLGAEVLDVPDPRDQAQVARRPLERARLIVLPGGSPTRLLKGMRATGLDDLLAERYADGCVVMGASAGAMVLCERLLLPERGLALAEGLGLVSGVLVIPHWSSSRPDWEEAAAGSGMQVLGIPEASGVVVGPEGIRAVGQQATRLVQDRQDLTPGMSNEMLGAHAPGGTIVVTEATPETGAAPVSDRMQALLSRAVEEQVSEQRAVSTVLAELREQVASLEAGVRGAAANDTVAALETAVSTVVADQRTATTLLSQRLEALTKRVEVLAALGEQVSAQGESIGAFRTELSNLAAFPTALAALQRDVAGLHDRLAPLGEVRAALSDLGARAGGSLDSLAPQLDALQAKLDALGAVPDAERLRDAVVDALSGRLERLQQAAERPVVGPEVLKSDLGDLRATLSVALGRELETLTESVAAVGRRVEQLEGSLAGAGGADLGPLTGELARLHSRLDDLTVLRGQVERLTADLAALKAEQTAGGVPAALAALADGLERLSERSTAPAGPTSDELSLAVSQRVADRLVETLAPRIADVVLTRVGAALVQQLGETLGNRLRADTEQVVASHAAASEQRLGARLDEGVMALAEALLRKKGGPRAAAKPVPPPAEDLPPVHEVVAELAAPGLEEVVSGPLPPAPVPPADPRPAVTTGMAPAPARPAAEPPAPAAEPPVAKAPVAKAVPTTAAPLKPAARPAAKKAAAKKAAPAKAPAKRAPVKEAKAPEKPAAKRPPVKKAAPRPRPLLEPAPAAESGDVAPVRPAPSHAAGSPPPPPPPPPLQQRPPAPPPPPTAPAREVVPPKRKPWWRPGS